MFPTGTGASSTRQLWDYRLNVFPFAAASTTIAAGATLDLFTVTGKGILGTIDLGINITATPNQITGLKVTVIIDGVAYDHTFNLTGTTAKGTWLATSGIPQYGVTTEQGGLLTMPFNTKFKSSVVLRLTNTAAGVTTNFIPVSKMTYYT